MTSLDAEALISDTEGMSFLSDVLGTDPANGSELARCFGFEPARPRDAILLRDGWRSTRERLGEFDFA